MPLHYLEPRINQILIECILISSLFCHAEKAKPAKPVLGRKQNTIVAVLKDRLVMTLMAVDLAAKTMDYRQTERDFLLGGFREHDVMLRPILGHPAAIMPMARPMRWARPG
jgi:hypothetical protein